MRYTFGKKYRLLKTDEFSSVFALRRAVSLGNLRIWRADNALGHPRLGLVVAKKTAKRAHERNEMKRCLREWFRLNRHELPAQDFVVQVRRAFTKQEFPAVRSHLEKLKAAGKTASEKSAP